MVCLLNNPSMFEKKKRQYKTFRNKWIDMDQALEIKADPRMNQ
jgi:hypothetical protein